jgi:hypothetical protein
VSCNLQTCKNIRALAVENNYSEQQVTMLQDLVTKLNGVVTNVKVFDILTTKANSLSKTGMDEKNLRMVLPDVTGELSFNLPKRAFKLIISGDVEALRYTKNGTVSFPIKTMPVNSIAEILNSLISAIQKMGKPMIKVNLPPNTLKIDYNIGKLVDYCATTPVGKNRCTNDLLHICNKIADNNAFAVLCTDDKFTLSGFTPEDLKLIENIKNLYSKDVVFSSAGVEFITDDKVTVFKFLSDGKLVYWNDCFSTAELGGYILTVKTLVEAIMCSIRAHVNTDNVNGDVQDIPSNTTEQDQMTGTNKEVKFSELCGLTLADFYTLVDKKMVEFPAVFSQFLCVKQNEVDNKVGTNPYINLAYERVAKMSMSMPDVENTICDSDFWLGVVRSSDYLASSKPIGAPESGFKFCFEPLAQYYTATPKVNEDGTVKSGNEDIKQIVLSSLYWNQTLKPGAENTCRLYGITDVAKVNHLLYLLLDKMGEIYVVANTSNLHTPINLNSVNSLGHPYSTELTNLIDSYFKSNMVSQAGWSNNFAYGHPGFTDAYSHQKGAEPLSFNQLVKVTKEQFYEMVNNYSGPYGFVPRNMFGNNNVQTFGGGTINPVYELAFKRMCDMGLNYYQMRDNLNNDVFWMDCARSTDVVGMPTFNQMYAPHVPQGFGLTSAYGGRGVITAMNASGGQLRRGEWPRGPQLNFPDTRGYNNGNPVSDVVSLFQFQEALSKSFFWKTQGDKLFTKTFSKCTLVELTELWKQFSERAYQELYVNGLPEYKNIDYLLGQVFWPDYTQLLLEDLVRMCGEAKVDQKAKDDVALVKTAFEEAFKEMAWSHKIVKHSFDSYNIPDDKRVEIINVAYQMLRTNPTYANPLYVNKLTNLVLNNGSIWDNLCFVASAAGN